MHTFVRRTNNDRIDHNACSEEVESEGASMWEWKVIDLLIVNYRECSFWKIQSTSKSFQLKAEVVELSISREAAPWRK